MDAQMPKGGLIQKRLGSLELLSKNRIEILKKKRKGTSWCMPEVRT